MSSVLLFQNSRPSRKLFGRVSLDNTRSTAKENSHNEGKLYAFIPQLGITNSLPLYEIKVLGELPGRLHRAIFRMILLLCKIDNNWELSFLPQWSILCSLNMSKFLPPRTEASTATKNIITVVLTRDAKTCLVNRLPLGTLVSGNKIA